MKSSVPPSNRMASSHLIGIDGDDTLWYSENVYEKLYSQVKSLFIEQMQWDDSAFSKKLHSNISLMGYGMKTYCISLVEYVIENSSPSRELMDAIIRLTKKTWTSPIILYKGANALIKQVSSSNRLVLITQGDSAEQSSKIDRCGLLFDNVEIYPQKNENAYLDLLNKRNVTAEQFIMIGNSFKTDILPVLNIGAKAIYVKSKWQFEIVDDTLIHPNLYRSSDLRACGTLLNQIIND